MLNKQLFLTLSFTTFLLTGCATTHNITITPQANIEAQHLTNTRAIKITTNTNLTNNVGTIKTALNERAEIYTENDVSKSIKESVIAGLHKLGFTPEQGVLPPADFNIEITKMSYVTRVETFKTVATLDFELKATLTAKGQTYTANYGAQKIKEFGTLPFQDDTQNDINELASQTVKRLLNDPNIIILLNN